MFKPLNRLVEKYKPEKKDNDYQLFLRIKKEWKKEVAKEIQKNAKLEDFTKGVLKIKAKNPTWRNELVFLKDGIKKNFHQTTRAK